MKLGLEGKTAIVTGGGRGLGRAIVLALADEGVRVVVADIDLAKAESVLAEIGGEGLVVGGDVSLAGDVDRLIDQTVKAFGGIDILVNNAGICPRTPLEDISEEEWDRVMAVNLKSVFMLSQKAFTYMKHGGGGKIVNIASAAGKLGGVQVGGHYSASKAGVICLTKTLALNGAKFAINVNAVCPGVIGTQMTAAIAQEQLDKYKTMIPLGRIGSPEDVANAVVFLASDAAGYITGEITDVNGGFLMD